MYLELVNMFRTTRKYGDGIRPRPSADAADISRAEKQLGIRFPQKLRDMLLEMDGDCDLLLCLEDIIAYNACQYSENIPSVLCWFLGRMVPATCLPIRLRKTRQKAARFIFGTMKLQCGGQRKKSFGIRPVRFQP